MLFGFFDTPPSHAGIACPSLQTARSHHGAQSKIRHTEGGRAFAVGRRCPYAFEFGFVARVVRGVCGRPEAFSNICCQIIRALGLRRWFRSGHPLRGFVLSAFAKGARFLRACPPQAGASRWPSISVSDLFRARFPGGRLYLVLNLLL